MHIDLVKSGRIFTGDPTIRKHEEARLDIFEMKDCAGFIFHGQQRKQMSGFLTKLDKEGNDRHGQSKKTSILWSHY